LDEKLLLLRSKKDSLIFYLDLRRGSCERTIENGQQEQIYVFGISVSRELRDRNKGLSVNSILMLINTKLRDERSDGRPI
jgi:hypothetical protein